MFSMCPLLPVLVEASFNVLDVPWDESNWFESCHHHNLWSLTSNLSNPSHLNVLSVLPRLSAPIGVWVIITCNACSPNTESIVRSHCPPLLLQSHWNTDTCWDWYDDLPSYCTVDVLIYWATVLLVYRPTDLLTYWPVGDVMNTVNPDVCNCSQHFFCNLQKF